MYFVDQNQKEDIALLRMRSSCYLVYAKFILKPLPKIKDKLDKMLNESFI